MSMQGVIKVFLNNEHTLNAERKRFAFNVGWNINIQIVGVFFYVVFNT